MGEPIQISQYKFEPLDKVKHDRAAFFCGKEALDKYIKQQARQDVDARVAAVFVATTDGKTIAGYYTLSQYAVDPGDLPPAVLAKLKTRRYSPLPATLIGRLARATTHKGEGLGELLLMSALERSLVLSREIASMAVIVDAKDDQAIKFYSDYGFIQLPDNPKRPFLPMATIELMFQ